MNRLLRAAIINQDRKEIIKYLKNHSDVKTVLALSFCHYRDFFNFMIKQDKFKEILNNSKFISNFWIKVLTHICHEDGDVIEFLSLFKYEHRLKLLYSEYFHGPLNYLIKQRKYQLIFELLYRYKIPPHDKYNKYSIGLSWILLELVSNATIDNNVPLILQCLPFINGKHISYSDLINPAAHHGRLNILKIWIKFTPIDVLPYCLTHAFETAALNCELGILEYLSTLPIYFDPIKDSLLPELYLCDNNHESLIIKTTLSLLPIMNIPKIIGECLEGIIFGEYSPALSYILLTHPDVTKECLLEDMPESFTHEEDEEVGNIPTSVAETCFQVYLRKGYYNLAWLILSKTGEYTYLNNVPSKRALKFKSYILRRILRRQ